MKFTPEQSAQQQKAAEKERLEEAKRQKRIQRGVATESGKIARMLRGILIDSHLRETVARKLGTYVCDQRVRVAGAFVRNH
ncbi:MAG: hypothetical protein UY50_C0025G0005 [Parcubacteria group bacterium GW2011_GWA2_49_9]|nr:MAG: hypothetical protein UY50_C0025G0005 [Parcubacteria group bacterium GW2011_GWA2_49_9]